MPVAPLREYYLEHLGREFSVCEVAELAGFVDRKGRAGTSQLQRRLGLRPDAPSRKNGKVYHPLQGDVINYDTAVRICRAMHAAPSEIRDEHGDPLL